MEINEIWKVRRELKNNAVPGDDGISPQMLTSNYQKNVEYII